MTDEAKWCVDMLREGACCSYCAIAFPTVGYPYPCEERIRTNGNMDKAANLIESISAELEQVKRERDAAVEDVRLAVCDDLKCSTCMYKGNESHMCDDCDVHTFCNWQWRGVKEETHD